MEFFFVTEKSTFKLKDKQNLTLEIELLASDQKEFAGRLVKPGKIYFITDILLPTLIKITELHNKRNILNFFKGREKIYSEILGPKNLLTKDAKNLEKKRFISDRLKIAVLFDISSKFTEEFNNSVIENLNYFYEKLLNIFPDVQIDVFTVYFSEWLDLAAHVPVTGLLLLPAPLDSLISYDVFFNFSDIVDSENIVDQKAIDLCLRNLDLFNSLSPFRVTVKVTPTIPRDACPLAGMPQVIREAGLNASLPVTSSFSPLTTDTGVCLYIPSPSFDLVSIIMPAYNRANYLAEAINSVLNQTYKNIELIIADDGSTDHTAEIAGNYSDPRIKYFYQSNQGVSAARNNAIRQAKGKYVMFLDDDDLFFPYSVQKLLSFIKKQPENVKLVYGDLVYFYGEHKTLRLENRLPPKPHLFIGYLTGTGFSTLGVTLAETKAVRDAGMFDESYAYAEDYELMTKLVYKYDFAKTDMPVILYRRHDYQATTSNRQTANWGKIRYLCDKIALKFWYRIKANQLDLFEFNGLNDQNKVNKILAENFENIAYDACHVNLAQYDTGLELLRFAQGKYYDEKRQQFIDYLSENIPGLIQEKYNCDLRISEQEKEDLKKLYNADK
jgi:glycosyltransferase involved in cell wall biosynthesis